MDIYNLKSFQEKVARFSVSPYAEAITTLAGLSPQVVGIASRLASSYASLRGTVQLLTTDEDNNIIDETTEARETIARSAVVSAWTSMGSAVERLVSLRKSLSGDGVAKSFPRTPVNYTTGESYAGNVVPCLIPHGSNLHTSGFSIMLPKNWKDHIPLIPGGRAIILPVLARNPVIPKIITANPTPGQAFQMGVQEDHSVGAVTVGGDRPVLFALRLDESNGANPVMASLLYMTLEHTSNTTFPNVAWKRLSGTMTFGDNSKGYYMASREDFPASAAGAGEVSFISVALGSTAAGVPDTWCVEKTQIYFPPASDQVESFDPVDPYEVFTQAYQAADAVLSLLEEMGYSSGLSQEDRALLSPSNP